MAKIQHYHCSACGKVFRYFHVRSDDLPECCQLCGAVMDENAPPVFVPKAPGIRKNLLVASERKLYRQMEEASIQRAREAASVAGVPDAEMAHLKITNMREAGEMREGDTAAIMPPAPANQVAQLMTQHPNVGGFGGAANASSALGRADAGAATHQNVVLPNHSALAQRMTWAGRMNR